MDPQTDLPDLVEDLEVNIDELTETLAPLLNTQLSTTASTLPLLDKSKLYVLAAYSIESLLYSSLQASGANAKEHAVFKELGRLKRYFAKIKEIEDRGTQPAQPEQPKRRLDVGAAARFIKHGLAGNDKYDIERAERNAKEKARAQLMAAKINKKFDDEDKSVKHATRKKRGAEEIDAADEQEDEDDDDEILGGLEEPQDATAAGSEAMDVDTQQKKHTRGKRSRKTKSNSPDPSEDAAAEPSKKKNKQNKKRGKKNARNTDAEAPTVDDATSPPTRAPEAGVEEAPAGRISRAKSKHAKGRPKKAK